MIVYGVYKAVVSCVIVCCVVYQAVVSYMIVCCVVYKVVVSYMIVCCVVYQAITCVRFLCMCGCLCGFFLTSLFSFIKSAVYRR